MTRRLGGGGGISLCTFPYHVGAWLAGETVDVVSDDRLVEIFHRGVLVATHARRHPLEVTPTFWEEVPRSRRETAAAAPGRSGGGGAGHPQGGCPRRREFGPTPGMRWDLAMQARTVEIRLVGDVVQIYLEGALIRTHRATHDPSKLHGAFGVPGRPLKKKAS